MLTGNWNLVDARHTHAKQPMVLLAPCDTKVSATSRPAAAWLCIVGISLGQALCIPSTELRYVAYLTVVYGHLRGLSSAYSAKGWKSVYVALMLAAMWLSLMDHGRCWSRARHCRPEQARQGRDTRD